MKRVKVENKDLNALLKMAKKLTGMGIPEGLERTEDGLLKDNKHNIARMIIILEKMSKANGYKVVDYTTAILALID